MQESEKQTLNTYDTISTSWAKARRLGKDSVWAEEFEKFRELQSQGSILDIGCGTGADSFWFIENGYEYLGIDGSQNMVAIAKENNPNAQFQVMLYEEIPQLRRKFNGFWAASSLLHIPKSSIKEILGIIKQVILPGGVGFISLKEGTGEKNEVWQDSGASRFFAYYEQQEFSKILELAEFSILSSGRKASKLNSATSWITYFVRA